MNEAINKQEIVLLNIAKNGKLCTPDEIEKFTGNLLNKKQIYNSLDSLERRKLIVKIKNEDNILIGLNLKKLYRTKEILRDYFESSWEERWKNLMGGKNANSP